MNVEGVSTKLAVWFGSAMSLWGFVTENIFGFVGALTAIATWATSAYFKKQASKRQAAHLRLQREQVEFEREMQHRADLRAEEYHRVRQRLMEQGGAVVDDEDFPESTFPEFQDTGPYPMSAALDPLMSADSMPTPLTPMDKEGAP